MSTQEADPTAETPAAETPAAEAPAEEREEIEAERERRLDPENRPENAEVDNTDRDFDQEIGQFTDGDIDPDLGPFEDPI